METLFNFFFLYTHNGKSHFKKVIYSRLLDILCKMGINTKMTYITIQSTTIYKYDMVSKFQ